MTERHGGLDRRRFIAGTAATVGLAAVGFELYSSNKVRARRRRNRADDLMASWWSVPRAVEVNGRTFAGGTSSVVKEGFAPGDEVSWEVLSLPTVDPGGVVSVIELGETARHEIHQGNSDDHNTPTLLMPADRPPIVFTSQHVATDSILYRKATEPLELRTLGPLHEIDLSSTGGKVTYTQAYRTGSTDQITAFARCGKARWVVVRSDDWGETWQTPQPLLDYGSHQAYMVSAQDGNLLRCVAYGHPAHDSPDLRSFQIDLLTGDVTSDGAIIADLDGTGLPLTPDDLAVAYETPPAHGTRLFDVSSTGEIAFAVWPESDLDAGVYNHLRVGGDEWVRTEIVPSGEAFGGHPPANYLGGMSFPNPADGSVWLSREQDGKWSVEHWGRSGEDWALIQTAASSTERKLVRPYCPVGASTGPSVLWNEVDHYAHSSIWLGGSMSWSHA